MWASGIGRGAPGSDVAHRHAPVADGDCRRDRRRCSAHGQRREASARSRDSTVVCPGFWLSIYFRPYGALVQYWEQRAWRGQGAAVAGGTVGGR